MSEHKYETVTVKAPMEIRWLQRRARLASWWAVRSLNPVRWRRNWEAVKEQKRILNRILFGVDK